MNLACTVVCTIAIVEHALLVQYHVPMVVAQASDYDDHDD
jgi:hypothetical protein